MAAPGAFGAALASRRVLFVAGSNTAGRASVAAAAAVALARRGPTLLVDADDPAHGMGDVLGTDLPIARTLPVKLPGLASGHLSSTRLSGTETRAFLEKLLATDRWRRLIEDDAGAKLARAVGVPLNDMVEMLDCIQPPPGAEMPVALARLLADDHDANKAAHVVVDAGAAVLALQLQSVPPAVADGLGGVLRLRRLLMDAKQAMLPSAVTSGIRLIVGQRDREGFKSQFHTTIQALERLRASMASLASAEKAVLLVLPHRPGRAGERAALRTMDRLGPSCVALTGHEATGAHLAPPLEWLPPETASVMLPWGEERPRGIDELQVLADAMLL